MAIWFRDYSLTDAQYKTKNTMMEHLGINITELGEDFITGTMPVDHRTKQPAGILHGGASVTLAETLGSIAAYLVVDPDHKFCVGLDINANHIRAVKSGIVTGKAMPLHLGSSTQVWNIEITDQENRLVCISRLTISILDKR
ncbi:MAG TPA: hotdog fold thioesterase [Flavisolibacter sp.]|nr:hotdog fold thioesterase [Flavisolibacter sp.]